MDRLAGNREVLADDGLREMYLRTLANWASDVLSGGDAVEWAEPDPAADYRNRDWKSLYTGSVLDD